MKRRKTRDGVNMICESIRTHPLDWTQENHTFVHKPTGLAIWTSNTLLDIGIHRTGKDTICSKFCSWNFRDKLAIKRAMKAHQDAVIHHYSNVFLSNEGQFLTDDWRVDGVVFSWELREKLKRLLIEYSEFSKEKIDGFMKYIRARTDT